MLRKFLLKGLLGVSAAAALLAALPVKAQTPGTTASGTAATASTFSRADKKILMVLAQAHMVEIESGRLAQTRSQSEQVKNFAQRMIDDHTKAQAEVQQLADARNIALPKKLGLMNRARVNRLGGLSGEAFDRAYMERAAVAEHKKTHDMLRQAETRAKDPDLKALVARTLPIVDQHLTSAQQLHKDTMQGSSRTQGTTGTSPDKKNE
ncbi:MAG: DUF4142 domain-containing protein [Pseudomonadota bacterium]